jgi:hypothetical protein
MTRELSEDRLRDSYLALPVHRRTLALAEEWGSA